MRPTNGLGGAKSVTKGTMMNDAREGEGRPMSIPPAQVRFEIAARICGDQILCNFCDRDAAKIWFNPAAGRLNDRAFVAVGVCWECNPDAPCMYEILVAEELMAHFDWLIEHLGEKSVRFDDALLNWLGVTGVRHIHRLRAKLGETTDQR